eukprot:3365334-Prymnesium_polylepis.2
MEPYNKDAMRELQALRSRFASHRKKEQKKFAGMFDKLSADSQEEEVAAPAAEASVAKSAAALPS